MNVQVRIMAAQAAAQLAALQRQAGGLGSGFNKSTTAAGGFGRALSNMKLDAFGSRLQWIGRQLEYNFTLPILAAAGASFKLALDNEKAFTRVTKVYGDASHTAAMYGKEIDALKRNFVALSNAYGVAQKDTINIAADWAAAGASGLALAKSVDLTMQTMVLGEMKAAEATTALIAIQAQYGENVDELTDTIGVLNMVENQTGISLEGLVQGFSRAAGVARDAGVDVRHLAAMLAALTPAAGSAAQAGNALKTIFSRLVSPTKETSEVLGLMGINIADMGWKSATATDKLMILAHSFNKLDKAQQNVVSSVVASRWQVNKFSVLMRDLLNPVGYYNKALAATNDEQKIFNQMQRELTAVLQSNPQKLKIIWTMLQNAAADIITPMIPLLLYLAQTVQRLVQAFSNLNPGVQKLIIVTALALAGFSLLVRVGGAVLLMVAELAKVVWFLLTPIKMLGEALLWLTKTPVIWFFTQMGLVLRAVMAATFVSLAAIVRGGMTAITVLISVGSRLATVAYGLGFGVMTQITTGVIGAIYAAWLYLMKGIPALILLGAKAAGAVWRAGLLAITAIQKAWTLLMLVFTRQFWVGFVLLAVRGFTALLTVVRGALPAIRAASLAVMAAMTGPWGAAIAVVLILVLAFWDQLDNIWQGIVRGTIKVWNMLPAGMRNALMAVVNTVVAAAKAVYNAMSWMNPWARHSPSLVDNVTTGVAEIKKQYNSAGKIADIFKKAGFTLASFASAVAKLKRAADLSDIANQRIDIAESAPALLGTFDKLVRVLQPLKDLLAQINVGLQKQQALVDQWKTKLDAANVALDVQQKALDKLQNIAQGYQDQLTAAQADLDKFANAPIEGMKAMSDAIFDNQMQQKALRLEMMQMEDTLGPLDKLKSRLDLINGQMEMLSGEQANLRNAGAGGEILSQYDDQISLLEQQQDAINAQIAPLQNLSDQIDELGRKAEMLDLQNSLQFDPLKKQVDDLANSMQELPFDEIMAGVTANKAKVDELTTAYNNANAAVKQQQAVVDQLTAARDAVQASYDLETAKLQAIQDEYDKVESKIRDIESAMQDMASAARDAAAAASKGMSPGAENFKAAAGGNFPDPGGIAEIGREGGWGDQSKAIDDFTKEMADKTKNMFGMFDFLEPIKKGWNKAWGWVKENVGGSISNVFGLVKDGIAKQNPFQSLGSWLDTIKEIGGSIKDAFGFIWDMIGPEVIALAKSAWKGLQDAFKSIQPEIAKFRDLVGPMGEALGNIWKILKPVLAVVLGLILLVAKALIGALAGALGPVLRMIGDIIGGVIRIIRGILDFLIGVFTGDWTRMWNGIKDIFGGVWDVIWGILKGAVTGIWGLVKGFVMGIIDFFKMLYDELVGHSIIPDMVNAIVDWFKKLGKWVADLWSALWNALKTAWHAVMDPVFNAIKAAIDGVKKVFDLWVAGVKAGWDFIKQRFSDAKAFLVGIIAGIVGVFGNIKDGWNGVVNWVADKIGTFINNFNNIKKRFSFGGMFDGLKSAFKSAMNWLIEKWNNFSLTLGGGSVLGMGIPSVTLNTPNIGYLAQGGMITKGAMAVIGEGRQAFPEYVIPTDPMHRRKALALFNKLGGQIGGNTRTNQRPLVYHQEVHNTTVHFHGNLEFPSVKNGDDAEEFLRNLEVLINEG